MKNGKIHHFFKRKACENASTSKPPIKVSRIEEVTTNTPQQVEVQSIEEVTVVTSQEVQSIDDRHSATRFGRSRLEENQVTLEHYFKVELFFAIIDQQLQELNSRFNEQAMNLLTLSCALNPKGNYKAFNIDTICTLVEKYYPMDFNEQDKIILPFQLRHFIVDARQSTKLKNLSTIQKLCSSLVATNKDQIYFLVDRLLCLIMTLPVSTATTERSFSAMKIIKTKLRNKMKGRFLANNMTVYIEKEISASISSDSIINDFKSLGTRRVKF